MSIPEVSVVIPTRGRPNLVVRAIRSALEQTFAKLEVIAVVDGPDAETISHLESIRDRRLKWLQLAQPSGGAAARNTGVEAAIGKWIAFLDDDDEWFAHKIETQLGLAEGSNFAYPIVCSRLIARGPKADAIWPRKQPRSPVSEYLFCRSSLFQGEGLIQTSSLLAKRALLQRLPFQVGLRKHQDWDWILRAAKIDGTGIEFAPEPLLIWNTDKSTAGVSNDLADNASREWLSANRALFTPRAYAAFLLTVVTPQVLQGTEKHRLISVVREAFAKGSPRVVDLLLFLGFCAIPKSVRYSLRSRLG